MKTKIQVALIRFSVKSFSYTFPIAIMLVMVAVNTKIPYNNFGLIAMFGILIMILIMKSLNGISDQVYNKAIGHDLSDYEHGYYRARCIGVSMLIGVIFILLFSSMSVGHPMTYPSADIRINGHEISGFHFVDILRSNTFR